MTTGPLPSTDTLPRLTLICATCGRRDALVEHMLWCYAKALAEGRGRRKP